MNDLHRVLRRQLRKIGIDSDPSEAVSADVVRTLIERIDRYYRSVDDDRYTAERSMEVSSRELTELHDRIRVAHARSHATLSAIAEAIVQVDADWFVQFANPAADKLFGMALEGQEFQHCAQWIDESGRAVCWTALAESLLQDLSLEAPDGHLEIAGGNGKTVPVRLTLSEINLAEGGFVVTVEDLTQRRRTRLALEHAKNDAQSSRDAERARGVFLASMSHELRTPLNAVLGYAEMLEEDLSEEGRHDSVQDVRRIRTAGRHLLGLINDILDLSKIDAGKMELHCADILVDELVHEVVDGTRHQVQKNNNQFVVEVAPNVGTLHADPRKLKQCLYNLISNAAKFTDQGTVTLRVHPASDGLVFEVQDTGIGIAPDRLPVLFEPFTQAHRGDFGGTGLGLTLTRAFVEMMHGSLHVDSQLGEGTHFRIQLQRTFKRGA